MSNDKTFFEKYYLLLFYFVFLSVDCWFLYNGQYTKRMYVKPLLIPSLLLWFMSNTAFNIRSSVGTLTARLALYTMLGFTFAADICGLAGDAFVWSAAMLLYTLSAIVGLVIFVSVQKNVSANNKLVFSLTHTLPTFLVIAILSAVYIHKVVEPSIDFHFVWICFYALILALLGSLIANMWTLNILRYVRVLFFFSVLFLIAANSIYGIDELVYHRRHSSLDLLVAISSALSHIFLILGIIKFIRLKKG